MTRVPDFDLIDSASTLGTTASGELQRATHHPFAPTALVAASGFLLVLNGIDTNRRLAENVGANNAVTTATLPLQMIPPREAITPLLTEPGTGRVFRQGAKWRYRWANSETGEVSGLSPLPDFSWNVGVETPANGTTYIGQTAHFYISTAAAPPGANTIELFANTTQEDGTWFRVDRDSFSGSTFVLLADDYTDDEIRNNLAVDISLPSGPTWAEGVMPPVTDALVHTTGRTLYWGVERMARFTSQQTTVDEGSDVVEIGGSPFVGMLDQGRIGQRVIFSTGVGSSFVNWTDPTVYRIAGWISSDFFRIYPEIQVSSEVDAGDVNVFTYVAIVDDRDGRAIWMSEPGKPWLIDPLKTIYAGDSFDDDVLQVFPLGTSYFAQTRKRIYAITNDFSVDPSQSVYVVPGPSEGMVGRLAGCVTPVGWAFLHHTLGVRLFNGSGVIPLGASDTPYEEFKPEDQLKLIEPSAIEITRLVFDESTREVVMSYVPLGGSCLTETLVFSLSERVWRGPNRERVFSAGMIDTATQKRVPVFGDDRGNLSVRHREDSVFLDLTPTTVTGAQLSGAVTSITSGRIFVNSAGGFNTDADERLDGSPIWFTDASGTRWFGRITGVPSTTSLELDGPVTDEDGNTGVVAIGWTYKIGAIRWKLVTSYIDGGDPIHPKTYHALWTRFRRGTTTETFYADSAADGTTTFRGVSTVRSTSSQAISSRDANGVTWGEMPLKNRGAAVQIRLYGLSTAGDPQITIAILRADVGNGTLST